MVIKLAIVTAYALHKIYWKKTHTQRSVDWNKFFAKG